MRADAILADRNRQVRLAARAWRKAGLLNDGIIAEIDGRFPDDRVRIGLGIRSLLFIFTLVAGCAFIFVLRYLALSPIGPLAIGLAFGALTEFEVSHLRLRGCGAEEATSVFAVTLTSGGLVWALSNISQPSWPVAAEMLGLITAALAALAVWRWAIPAYGAVACLALFYFVSQNSAPRTSWVILATVLVVACEAIRRKAALAPSHRAAFTWALIPAIALGYLSTNVWALDRQVLAHFGDGWYSTSGFPWGLSIFLTATLPLLAFLFGAWRRDRLWLLAGLMMVAAGAATLTDYVYLGPRWLQLTGSGAAAIGIALGLRHWLEAGRGHERHGFTAQPLFGGNLEAPAEVVAALATMAPPARELATQTSPPMRPGGGTFGGGGASDTF